MKIDNDPKISPPTIGVLETLQSDVTELAHIDITNSLIFLCLFNNTKNQSAAL